MPSIFTQETICFTACLLTPCLLSLWKPGLEHAVMHCMLEPVDFARVVQYEEGSLWQYMLLGSEKQVKMRVGTFSQHKTSLVAKSKGIVFFFLMSITTGYAIYGGISLKSRFQDGSLSWTHLQGSQKPTVLVIVRCWLSCFLVSCVCVCVCPFGEDVAGGYPALGTDAAKSTSLQLLWCCIYNRVLPLPSLLSDHWPWTERHGLWCLGYWQVASSGAHKRAMACHLLDDLVGLVLMFYLQFLVADVVV